MPPSLRIALVQLSPVFKDVPASIDRANHLTASLVPGELDLLILPEMAFSGYCFSKDDIEPWLEDPHSGPSFQWSSAIAKQLACYVLLGFPERSPPAPPPSSDPAAPPTQHNSLLLISPLGALITIYRKHFLYTTDESWAIPGDSFQYLDLPFPPSNPFSKFGDTASRKGKEKEEEEVAVPVPTFRICPCICMDINPWKFQTPFEDCELANFAKEKEVDLVLCSMAWLRSEELPPPPESGTELGSRLEEEEGTEGEEWGRVSSLAGYWAARMKPLLGSGVVFVACNRVGKEGEVTFAGSSCVMVLDETPEVLVHARDRGEALVRSEFLLKRREAVEF